MSNGTFTRALLLGAAVFATAGLLPPTRALADEAKHTVSNKLAKPLKEAQEDLNKKKYADAITKLKAAEAIEGKTPYDQHVINDFLSFGYVHTQDYAGAARSMEAEIDDGFLSQSEIPSKVRGLAEVEYQVKNYDKAIEYGQRAIKGGYADDSLKKLVGQAYYLKGDWKGTLHFEDGLVDPVIKGGGTPSSESLQLILSSCVKMDDSQCTTKALEHLVTYYPKPDYWYQLLYTISKQAAASDTNTFETYRLMNDVDVLKTADDYTEMAQLALEFGSPGEAEHVLEKGFAKTVFTDQRSKDKNTRLLEKAKQAAALDQKTLPKTQGEADAATTGGKDVGMGIAYFGYEQYDKAADELSKGIAKGGLQRATEAQLLLGIAQLKAGHKDDAVKSFHAVKGDPILERLASLWALHAKQA